MKIMMIQPNYHSGRAEIAGNWPPSWVPYVGGALKKAGFDNIRNINHRDTENTEGMSA